MKMIFAPYIELRMQPSERGNIEYASMEDVYAASKNLVERFLLHMHEMGIILHLAKTLDQVAEENHLSKIGAVTVEIGEVSGIVTDLFEDAWNYFSKKHPVLTGSELRIETIPAVTHCEGCGENYETVAYGRICPYCGSGETWLIRGNECIIKEIEAE